MIEDGGFGPNKNSYVKSEKVNLQTNLVVVNLNFVYIMVFS